MLLSDDEPQPGRTPKLKTANGPGSRARVTPSTSQMSAGMYPANPTKMPSPIA